MHPSPPKGLLGVSYSNILENHYQGYDSRRWKGKWKLLVAQSCLTLCDPMDCNLPGSSIQGILQAKILEWVAISFSMGSCRLRDGTCAAL